MKLDDRFLRKLYKLLALLWMVAVILMSVGVGLAHHFRDGAEFFLFMMYPYYAVTIIYLIIQTKHRILASSKDKWIQQGIVKLTASMAGEQILCGLLMLFSFIPYLIMVMFLLKFIDYISVNI